MPTTRTSTQETEAERFVRLRAAAIGAGRPITKVPEITRWHEGNAVIEFSDGSAAFALPGQFPSYLRPTPSVKAAVMAHREALKGAPSGLQCPYCGDPRPNINDRFTAPTCGANDCQRKDHNAARAAARIARRTSGEMETK